MIGRSSVTMNSPPPKESLLKRLERLPEDKARAVLASLRGSAQLRATERVREEQARKGSISLSSFIREAWPLLEPGKPYVHGWHLDAIAEHLQAVTDGSIRQLVINVPPGMMKSLQTSVFWPAFEWGPLKRPDLRYISTSHSADFSVRDSRKMRDLVQSEWYQALWPHVRLTRTGESSFANDRQGFREAMPFTELTGARGDRVIIDDPQSADDAESESRRARAARTFRETIPLRINDARTSAIVIIMQRLHDADISALAIEAGYTHLMLPMEFEPERRCRTVLGFDGQSRPKIFQDPRQRDGDLIFPQRFSRDYVNEIKRTIGSYAIAGQLQQRPVPREGGLFKAAWFPPERFIDPAVIPAGTVWVRHWDLAASVEEGAAYTAGVKLGRAPNGKYIVGHVARFRAGPGAVEERIVATAKGMDGRSTTVSIPQDPGAAGKVQAHALITALDGFTAYAAPESGDKVQRALPLAAQAENGNVLIVRGEWNPTFMDELLLFPGSKFKDQVDALSGAYARLARVADVPWAAAVVVSSPNSVPGGMTPRHGW
jgi:predicted phage terminase large subunit-like protein